MRARWLGCIAAALIWTGAYAQGAGGGIRIGVLSDFSGPYSAWGAKGSVIAAEMAVEDFRKTNPAFPYKVEIVSGDFQLKADQAVAIAKKWLGEGINAIIDIPHSPSALAVNAVVRGTSTALLVNGSAHNDLVTKECSPNQVHWTYDQHSIGTPTVAALSEGGKSWFFITVDAAGGKALEDSARAVIAAKGGKVAGALKNPANNADFSSHLLQAQASKADVVAILQGGTDTINAVKQAQEFGIAKGGQKVVLLWATITDVQAMGLKSAQGLTFTEAFYWDANDGTRAFARRFMERYGGKAPTSVQAGAYSVVMHYLKAVEAGKSINGPAVVAKMKEIPVSDRIFGNAKLRADGRMVHDMLLVEVKKPEESKSQWDVYKVLRVVPGDEAYRPMSKECSLVR